MKSLAALAFLFALFLLGGCSSFAALPFLATPTPTITPTPPPTATPTCDPKPFAKETAQVLDQLKDLTERAGSTSRIALSPVIGEMQTARRDYKNLQAPACAQKLQQLVTEAMDFEIQAFLAFMQQDTPQNVNYLLRRSGDRLDEATAEIKRLFEESNGTPTAKP